MGSQITCPGCGINAYHGQTPKRYRCRICGYKHKLSREERNYLILHGSLVGYAAWIGSTAPRRPSPTDPKGDR